MSDEQKKANKARMAHYYIEQYRRLAESSFAAPTLLACPFCAEAGELKEQHAGHFVVQCTNEHCGVKRQPELSPLAAVTVWNERARQARPYGLTK
jgi:predicted  nucleic acid-binding Zn ribbon protein